jgi:hypothetical protein
MTRSRRRRDLLAPHRGVEGISARSSPSWIRECPRRPHQGPHAAGWSSRCPTSTGSGTSRDMPDLAASDVSHVKAGLSPHCLAVSTSQGFRAARAYAQSGAGLRHRRDLRAAIGGWPSPVRVSRLATSESGTHPGLRPRRASRASVARSRAHQLDFFFTARMPTPSPTLGRRSPPPAAFQSAISRFMS